MALALSKGADIEARNPAGQTALVFALERAQALSRWQGPKVTLEAIQFLMEAGAGLEATDSLGATAIHHAVRIPDPEFLKLVLRFGGNPRHVTKSGYSVLLHACFQPSGPEKIGIIEHLHETDASLDAASEHDEFPVGVCLRFGDLLTLRRLIQLGADPKPLQWSEAHHAVAFGGLAELEHLSLSAEAINAKNLRFGLSPWLLSVIRGDIETVKSLAEHGTDLSQTGRCGVTSLHLAAEFGRVEALSWLLDLGANPNTGDDFGQTPLLRTSEWNQLLCARALLGKVAESTDTSSQPIHAAHSLEMVQLLVEVGGADVNAVDGCGDWPLKNAAANNDLRLVNWLLDHAAKLDLTSTGETTLHAAVRADAREVMKLLLERGANPNAQDVDGWTPLFGASSREAIHLLLEFGADPKLTDQAGWGPERWLKDPILLAALRGE